MGLIFASYIHTLCSAVCSPMKVQKSPRNHNGRTYPFAGDGAPLTGTLLAGRVNPKNECSNRWSSFRKRLMTRSSDNKTTILYATNSVTRSTLFHVNNFCDNSSNLYRLRLLIPTNLADVVIFHLTVIAHVRYLLRSLVTTLCHTNQQRHRSTRTDY